MSEIDTYIDDPSVDEGDTDVDDTSDITPGKKTVDDDTLLVDDECKCVSLVFIMVVVAVAYLIVISDVFVTQVLSRIPDATKGGEPTIWGCLIQMVALIGSLGTAVLIKKTTS
jgi:hypothetical protein